jgi:RNA recognition motif-containing protein
MKTAIVRAAAARKGDTNEARRSCEEYFVANLHSETTAGSIRSFFEPVGAVRKLELMMDRKTGLSRGFAFIEMAEAEADTAIATLHGKILDGRAIHIQEGRQKVHGLASPEHLTRNDAAPDHP